MKLVQSVGSSHFHQQSLPHIHTFKQTVAKVVLLLDEHQHEELPIMPTTIKSVRADVLICLYNFLVGEIMPTENVTERPKYIPGKTSYPYKRGVIDFIAHGFGFDKLLGTGKLDRRGRPVIYNPCDYSPAFLEALANFCIARTASMESNTTVYRGEMIVCEKREIDHEEERELIEACA